MITELEWKMQINSRNENKMKHREDFLCIDKSLFPWNDFISHLCWLYNSILGYLNVYCRTCFLFLKIQKVIKKRKTVTWLWNKMEIYRTVTNKSLYLHWTKVRVILFQSNLQVNGNEVDRGSFRWNVMVYAQLSVNPCKTLINDN